MAPGTPFSPSTRNSIGSEDGEGNQRRAIFSIPARAGVTELDVSSPSAASPESLTPAAKRARSAIPAHVMEAARDVKRSLSPRTAAAADASAPGTKKSRADSDGESTDDDSAGEDDGAENNDDQCARKQVEETPFKVREIRRREASALAEIDNLLSSDDDDDDDDDDF